MSLHQGQQTIKQLEQRKGGYYYLKIEAAIVGKLSNKRKTRLICTIDNLVSYRCGLNHLGDGNFYLIVSGKRLKALGKNLGDLVAFSIEEDPDQLGVAIPEVLEVLLAQDPEAKSIFDVLTDGKKRSLIYAILKVKDLDKQVRIALDFLNEQNR